MFPTHTPPKALLTSSSFLNTRHAQTERSNHIGENYRFHFKEMESFDKNKKKLKKNHRIEIHKPINTTKLKKKIRRNTTEHTCNRNRKKNKRTNFKEFRSIDRNFVKIRGGKLQSNQYDLWIYIYILKEPITQKCNLNR